MAKNKAMGRKRTCERGTVERVMDMFACVQTSAWVVLCVGVEWWDKEYREKGMG